MEPPLHVFGLNSKIFRATPPPLSQTLKSLLKETKEVNDNLRSIHDYIFDDGSSAIKSIDQIVSDFYDVPAKQMQKAFNDLYNQDPNTYQGSDFSIIFVFF